MIDGYGTTIQEVTGQPTCPSRCHGQAQEPCRFTACQAPWHGAPVPTVAQILELETVRRARPRVVAGASGLGREVRWTHVAELPDIAHLLRGGELLLSTGVAFPDVEGELAALVESLADAGAAGLVVELGRRYEESLPRTLVDVADARGLPVVELRREVSFVQVTEAVHALVVGAQLSELRASDEMHRTFTELSIEGADPEAVVRQTARMANAPVVFEGVAHQVLAFDPAGTSADQLLDRWEARSRSIRSPGRTTVDDEQGWVLATVGARGTTWGRLVIVLGAPPAPRHVVLAERAANALALGRLIEREDESVERQSHRTLLTSLVDQSMTSHELQLRAQGLGVPLAGRWLVGAVLRPVDHADSPLSDQAQVRRLAAAAADGVRSIRADGLVAVLDESTVGLVLAADDGPRLEQQLAALAGRARRTLGDETDVVVAAGSVVTDVLEVRRTLLEARQVADVAPAGTGSSVQRLTDVGLDGLLHLLGDDERVQTFVERELGALLAHDAASGRPSGLLDVLRVFLDCGRNKSTAAVAYRLSRPAFYERLRSIEALLDADLDDTRTCLSLHVAVRAHDVRRQTRG